MARSEWYVAIRGDVFGPVGRSELGEWAAEGRVPEDARARSVRGGTWCLVSDVAELRGLPLLAPPGPTAEPPRDRPPAPIAESKPPVLPPVDQIDACPECFGPVRLVTPTFGVAWMRESTRLRCGRCGMSMGLGRLTADGRLRVASRFAWGTAFWVAVVAVLLAMLALPVLMVVGVLR